MDRKRWKHSAHRLVLHLALQPQPPFAALMPPARPPVLSVCEQTAIGPSHTGCPLPQLPLSYRLGSRKSALVTHGSEGPECAARCDADPRCQAFDTRGDCFLLYATPTSRQTQLPQPTPF